MNSYHRERGSMTLWDLLFLIGMWTGACVAIGMVASVGWSLIKFGWGLVP